MFRTLKRKSSRQTSPCVCASSSRGDDITWRTEVAPDRKSEPYEPNGHVLCLYPKPLRKSACKKCTMQRNTWRWRGGEGPHNGPNKPNRDGHSCTPAPTVNTITQPLIASYEKPTFLSRTHRFAHGWASMSSNAHLTLAGVSTLIPLIGVCLQIACFGSDRYGLTHPVHEIPKSPTSTNITLKDTTKKTCPPRHPTLRPTLRFRLDFEAGTIKPFDSVHNEGTHPHAALYMLYHFFFILVE